MSLILGVHLLERIYLVSDTRVSSSDGTKHTDDLIKAFKINDRITALAAGNGLAASFALNQLKKLATDNTTIGEIKSIIESELKNIMSQYVNTTGMYGQVALIFGGFNHDRKKKIEVSTLGNAMSAMVIPHEGQMVRQSIDPRLRASFSQLPGKQKGDYIVVDGVHDADLFSLTFDVQTAHISHIDHAACYEYQIYHPNQRFKTITLPAETVSMLEFRLKSDITGEEVLYEDSEILMTFVNKVIKENSFASVGGHIITITQFPVGATLPTGDIAIIQDGIPVMLGGVYVRDNKLKFKSKDGQIGEYRYLEDLYKNFSQKLELQELQI